MESSSCGRSFVASVAEQMQQIGIAKPNILLEPEGRNTAPAAAHFQ